MDQKQIDILTKKIADQTISDAEFQQYYDWLSADDGQPLEVLEASSKEELENRIYSKIADHTGIPLPHTRKVRLWPRIAIAAAVATIIFGAGLYFFKGQQKETKQSNTFALIKPGHNGATLTLSNGKQIKLSEAINGELANEAGVTITKSANGQLIYQVQGSKSDPNKINTLSTAKGETYQLRLPDGSLVWLNAASSLTYSAALIERGVRRVKLEGEGYFEIAKDKAHPFIVSTEKQEVEVLGTHFNVYSYNDEDIVKTTLLEGSVKINNQKIIKPGEQASNSANGKIEVAAVNVDKVTAWKNGRFVFEDETIESIMRKLSRWYNVEVVFQDDVKDIPFTAFISRRDDISSILEKITYTQNIHFKVEGRRITVMK